MNKTEENIRNQNRATIITLNPNPVVQAFIYSNEQRAKHISGIVGHEVEPTVEAIDEALEDYMEEHENEDIFYSFHEFQVCDS